MAIFPIEIFLRKKSHLLLHILMSEASYFVDASLIKMCK